MWKALIAAIERTKDVNDITGLMVCSAFAFFIVVLTILGSTAILFSMFGLL